MKTVVCFVLILTVSVATDVQVYVYRGESHPGPKPAPRDAPFTFGYHFGDVLSMHLFLDFKNVNVTADLYRQYPSGGANIEQKVMPKLTSKGSNYYKINHYLDVKKIIFDLEINTKTGHSTRKQIVRGIIEYGFVFNLPNATSYTPYDSSCLKSLPCMVEVLLSDDVNATVKAITDAELPTSTYKDMSTTTIKSTANDTNLEQSFNHTKTYVITAMSSIAATALVLVVIVAIRTRCWGRLETPAPKSPLQLPNNEPCGPFYVNMLFRDQCAQEIADIEKHQYEEIGGHPNHETENQYEEIVPSS